MPLNSSGIKGVQPARDECVMATPEQARAIHSLIGEHGAPVLNGRIAIAGAVREMLEMAAGQYGKKHVH